MASGLLESTDKSVGTETVRIAAGGFEGIWRPTLAEVWEDHLVTDMTLKVAAKTYQVHRLVMLVYSSKLRKKITSSDLTDTRLEVYLDMDPVMVEKALEFIYKGLVDIDSCQLQELAEVAQQLGIDSLRNKIMAKCPPATQVTSKNCLSVWQFAAQHGQEDLAREAKAVAVKEFNSLQHTDGFKELNATVVLEYLNSDDLVCGRVEDRLLAVLRWIHVDPGSRLQHLCPVLECLPLAEMTLGLDRALQDPLISDSAEAREKINEVKASKLPGKKPSALSKDNQIVDVEGSLGRSAELQPKVSISQPPALHHFLVVTGHSNGNTCSNEVVAIDLTENYQCVSVGRIQAEFDYGTNCCIHGKYLYVSCLEPNKSGIWRFNLLKKTSSLFTRVETPRCEHAMTAHHTGHLYITAGQEPSHQDSTSSVEAVDLVTGSSQQVGRLKLYNCQHNVRSCEVEGET